VVAARGTDLSRAQTKWGADATVVSTPLEMISTLEADASTVTTVVLGDAFASDRDIVAFLLEMYPTIELVIDEDRDPLTPPSPAFA
jgi:hypothetical protein